MKFTFAPGAVYLLKCGALFGNAANLSGGRLGFSLRRKRPCADPAHEFCRGTMRWYLPSGKWWYADDNEDNTIDVVKEIVP